MTKMIIRDISRPIKKGSIPSETKIIYRSGFQYLREADPIDSEKHTQYLVVVHEPDVWQIDIVAKSGVHLIDPDGEVHVPIWPDNPVPEQLKGFEYGTEFDFINKHQGAKLGPVTIVGIPCDKYVLKRNKYKVILLSKCGLEVPLEVMVYEGYRKIMDYYYASYESGLPFDESIFEFPTDVNIKESLKEVGYDPQEFKPEGSGCSVLMFGAPQRNGSEKTEWFSADMQNQVYGFSYSNLDGPAPDPKKLLAGMANAGAQAIGRRVAGLRFLNYKGYPACEFRTDNAEGHISLTRICLVHKRKYVLVCSGNSKDFDEKHAQKYFDSLKISQY